MGFYVKLRKRYFIVNSKGSSWHKIPCVDLLTFFFMNNDTGAIMTLMSLVQINSKRLDLYKKSADKAKQVELKLLFMRYAVQSQGFINLLNRQIMEYGGAPVSGEVDSGLTVAWNKIKETLASDARPFLLHRCEVFELEAMKVYSTVLSLTILSASALQDIHKQANEIELAYYTMKGMQLNDIVGLPVAA
jgi:uncharacterized protein (TIGR02284 family)